MREWLQGRVGRLLLATLLLSAAVALTGACGGGSDEPSPTTAAVEAPASTPTAMPATSAPTVVPTLTPTPTPVPTPIPTPTPTPTLAPTPTSTPEPTPTAEPTPTPDPTRSSSDSSGGELLDLDEDTTWQDVYDTLSSSEQSCIRDTMDEDKLESLLELNVLRSEAVAGPEEIGAITCLEPEKASTIYTSAVIASMGDASPETQECVRELVTGLDLIALLDFIQMTLPAEGEQSGEPSEEPPEEMFQFMMGMLACVGGEMGTLSNEGS